MIFEKQQYQQDCVNNIITALNNIDFDNNDFSQLSETLKPLTGQYNYPQNTTNKNQLDVLMETGTGKTFTYLETIFELNKQFKLTKFMIVLPRTAIKLGVIQNIKYAKRFFQALQKELPKIEIKYQTRINGQELSDILGGA